MLSLGPAEQKACSFFVLILVGYVLRPKLNDKKMLAGVRGLVLNGLLPAVIFGGLLSVKLSVNALSFPLLNAAHIAVHLLVGSLVGRLVLPGASLERVNARSTLAFLSSSFAPGLSAFVFIKEFAPSGMAMGALMDLASKAYLLIACPALMRRAFGDAAAKKKGAKPVPPGSLFATLWRELCEPLNFGIVAGLAASALGLKHADLGPVGGAIQLLEAAQTPVLFVLIGLTVSLEGDAPVVCGAATLLRSALSMACAYGAVQFLQLEGETALALVIMFQSACSVVCFAQLEKVANTLTAAGRDGEVVCALPLALDLVGYSFPLAIALNASAGLLRERYIELMPSCALALVAAAGALTLAAGGSGGKEEKAKAS
ncbi:hypothetical protein T492DRAFT_1141816 [Pavlovales sp. CCMP2436]|nr:hypothetical protein T492DRAFT_1141816 [Pavlovales sp. CCMP2436]